MNKTLKFALLVSTLFICQPAFGQATPYYQPHFPPEEFKVRWQQMFDRIGNNIAIVQGGPKARGYAMPRQTNEFYYLCGIETPHSYVVLDGRSRKVMLYLPPRDERLERSEGKILSADDAELVRKLTGADVVGSTQQMTEAWARGLLEGTPPPAIYTLFTPSEGSAEQRNEAQSYDAGIALDYWDGRISREANFVQLLRTRFPRTEVRDLTPILDELRSLKSQREVALIRRASQLAGLGLLEAIKNTKPGRYEYQLDAIARFVFLAHGARLEGYRSITASGTPNIWNGHYYRNLDQLKAGDLVLMDFAPEYGYYTSDVARMWPVSGKFSPTQRELLQVVLEYRNAVLKRIRPGVTAKDIQNEAAVAMEAVFKKTKFSKPIYEQAARKMVETGGGVFSHPVGMAVHDDGGYKNGVLKPGHVFSIDPQLWVPEETLYIRYEDVVVITETGVENFTHLLPTELDEIEKLVGQGGVLQMLPRLPN